MEQITKLLECEQRMRADVILRLRIKKHEKLHFLFQITWEVGVVCSTFLSFLDENLKMLMED